MLLGAMLNHVRIDMMSVAEPEPEPQAHVPEAASGPELEPDWHAAAVWQVFVVADVDADGYLCSAEYRRLLQATAVWQVRLPPSIWPRLARAWLA